jgi:hypothetical protein
MFSSNSELFDGKLLRFSFRCSVVLLVAVAFCTVAFAATQIPCTSGAAPFGNQANPPDLVVTTGTCTVKTGTYYFHNVNVFDGGQLLFEDPPNTNKDNATTDFWAESILVQNNGTVSAGLPAAPIGSAGGRITIHLWGADQGGSANGSTGSGGNGITCLMPDGKGGYTTDPTCGVPDTVFVNKMDMSNMNPASCTKSMLPGNVNDCFYQYAPIDYDGGDPNGYFGYKVLAVSYGGTLNLYGKHGASYPAAVPLPATFTGTSWVRLAKDIPQPTDSIQTTTLVVNSPVDWKAGDQIVVTTTDYLPGHSEMRVISSVDADKKTIHITTPFQYAHNGTKVDLASKGVPATIGPTDDPNLPAGNGRLVDTRAAVALLSRSIRIVSGGDKAGQPFPDPVTDCTKTGNPTSPSYFFGGHTIFRQGFQSVQVQGVEFYQLGQGGRIMHYPVHFHMARKTPQPALNSKLPLTFLKDNSVWDSMTRWYTLHATQGVYLARNVGYLSVGHGYYLEDATETNNTLYSNIGISPRSAVGNIQNCRAVPGILAGGYTNGPGRDDVPYTSDADHPTVFWITNGWNDFQYNFAAGANSCGVCYWFLPAGNSGNSRFQAWEGYASEQKMFKNTCTDANKNPYTCDDYVSGDSSPLMKFVGNTCSTAMESFLTISQADPCGGVVPSQQYMTPIPNTKIPPTPPIQTTLTPAADNYYPKIDPGGSRLATACPATGDCNPLTQTGAPTLKKCGAGQLQEKECMVTTIDHYLTSFNWSQQNFAAVWLRPQWYLFSNSAITDVQTGGITMVTAGDYTDSSVIPGYWALTRNSVFIGETQPGNYYASAAGPFNQYSQKAHPELICAGNGGNGLYCLNENEGMTMPLSNFAVNQRFFNIYDGPAYQDRNAYIDITKTTLDGCLPNTGAQCSFAPNYWMYGIMAGIPLDPTKPAGQQCYMPNAAIAWKQPNGFFYPPAFHDQNLYFSNVDTRHFVILPLFKPTDYLHPFVYDSAAATARYCTYNSAMFSAYTDIDRQTELTDDDGSLTGLISKQTQNKGTHEVIVVNKDEFFDAPYQDTECESDINVPPLSASGGTAISSPYEYVTTVVYPSCAPTQCGTYAPTKQPYWNTACSTQNCYGVPLYRLDITGTENTNQSKPFITLAGAAIGQRNTMTVNHGTYYIDTTVSADAQALATDTTITPPKFLYTNYSVFLKNQTYYTFLLYAKKTTVQTYEMYIGTGLDPELITGGNTIVFAVQVNKSALPFKAKTITTWPTDWTRTYNPTTGIVKITMNLTNADFTETFLCAPKNFCTGDSTSCGCALKPTDPTYTPSIFAQCQAACSQWATKDLDCPDAGCYGFGVNLTENFTYQQHITPPAPSCFSNDSNWNQGFANSTINSGGCQYPDLPKGNFCQGGGSGIKRRVSPRADLKTQY